MKRCLHFLIYSAIIAVLLTGCSLTERRESSSGGQVVLDFWTAWGPDSKEEKVGLEVIEEFEKKHPNVKVNVQVMTFDMLYDNIITSINAGNAPDISWGLGEWFGDLNHADALLDLTPYFNKWEDNNLIYNNVIDALTVNGKLKALPNYLGNRAFLYNKDILDKAGIDDPPKTWEELIAMGPVIKEKTGKYAFGISGTGVRAPQELIMYLAQNDLQLAIEDSKGKYRNTWNENPDELERAAEVFQFYKDLLEKGVIDPNGRSWGHQEEDTNFSLAQYAMVVNGSWMESTINDAGVVDNLGIAHPPAKEVKATYLEINPYYIFKDTEHPELAWELIKAMYGDKYQKEANLYKSPRTDVKGEGLWAEGYEGLTEMGAVFPQVSLGKITNDMTDAVGRVLLLKENPEETASWLGEEINNSLETNDQISKDAIRKE
jgi:multiple sugar transport system substrate-binding protein